MGVTPLGKVGYVNAGVYFWRDNLDVT